MTCRLRVMSRGGRGGWGRRCDGLGEGMVGKGMRDVVHLSRDSCRSVAHRLGRSLGWIWMMKGYGLWGYEYIYLCTDNSFCGIRESIFRMSSILSFARVK